MLHRNTLVPLLAVAAAGCTPDLDTTRGEVVRGTFGETIYREGCQRVAYTAQLDERAAGVRQTVDVSGEKYAAPVCVPLTPAPPPDDAPVKLKALAAQRAVIVAAADRIFPKTFLDPLESFLESIVDLSDDGTLEAAIGKTGDLLGAMKDDDELNAALARLSGRAGYRPMQVADLVRTFVSYAGLDDLLGKTLDLLLDGNDEPTPELTALVTALARELQTVKPLAAPSDQSRTLKLAVDLFLTTSPDFGDGKPRPLTQRDWRGLAQINPDGNGQLPAPFVDNNGDGLADADASGQFLGANGKPLTLASPFPQAGTTDTAPRDNLGRLIDAQGRPVYRYLDLDPTFVAALTREAVPLFDPKKDTALGLLWGTSALMGPRSMQTRVYIDPKTAAVKKLNYNGYFTDDAPLLDLVHGFLQILGDPAAPDTLLAARTLLTKYEAPTTRVINAMFDANDRGKKHPEARIPATSNLFDELAQIIVRISRVPGLTKDKPTLAEDLLIALQDPHVRGLGPMLARQMIFKDRFILNQSNQTVSGSFATPVDYTSPDNDWNRSVMQRMAHLIHDSNGAKFCNKQDAHPVILGIDLGSFHECELFEIKDIGYFFVLAMADHSITDDPSRPETRSSASFRDKIQDKGMRALVFDNGTGDFFLEQLVGISGFTRFPTPQAAARSLFLDHDHQSDFMKNSVDPVLCTDGDQFMQVHADSVFAWEATLPNNPSGYAGDQFYDAIRPLVNAFARHDECVAYDELGNCTAVQNAAKIFVDLMSLLHEHWGSSTSTYFGHGYQSADKTRPRYSSGDGAYTYERLTGEILGTADIMPAVIGLAPTLNTMTLDGTNGTAKARPALVKTLSYLFDPAVQPKELAYRNGKTTTLFSDGKTPGPRATPYYLIADAFARKRDAVAAAPPAQRDAWNRSTTSLIDQMLTIDGAPGQTQMKSRHFHGMFVALIDFVRGRLAAHTADREEWAAKQLTADVTDLVASPIFAALSDLVARIESTPAARDALYKLLGYLIDQAQSDATFQAGLTGLADNVQLFLDDPDMVPIAHALGNAVDPDQGAVNAQLKLLQRAKKRDPNCPKAGEMGKYCTLVTLLRNLYQNTPEGVAPAARLADALAEIDRATPGSGTAYTAEDFKAILANSQSFLTDEQRGFIRFVRIVKNRRYP
jgi:hypothetical protein